LDVKRIDWDLVIIDEAHRLRNVYKKNNVTGNKLKSIEGKKKLLLTATPLQNNLMELYGLVSIIDERVFSDAKTFRDKYVNIDNEEARNIFLRARLQQFCKRTLRKQVTEYVPYTKRIAILEEYTPSEAEEKLYNEVSEYLQSETLYALPNSQRKLMTMILRKLLASSSFAISSTLDSLIVRLEGLLKGIDSN
jgi:SNF2 family DNA or RNA helicase